MIKKILVAADASAAANRAVVLAAHLASKHDAELLILHVIRDMQLPAILKKAPELEQFNHKREDILRQVAETILTEATELARKEGAEKVQTAIGSGDPASSVVGFAKRRNIDTIVVGTRGLGKMKGLLMGGVSRKILDNAEANCIIVR
ncbi:MAG: nucleotide-binding universal stress UspA family protein [Gammaproteobacteria bacterium]|jgi:nucleotide-binding universal stress UspA family protein